MSTIEGEQGTAVQPETTEENTMAAAGGEGAEASSQSPSAAPSLPMPERTVSNEEAMIAQVLSRVKKQAKQIEKMQKTVGQILDSLKRADKERAKHGRQVEQQNKKMMSQVAQLQKRLAKAGKNAGGKGRNSKARSKAGKKKAAAARRR